MVKLALVLGVLLWKACHALLSKRRPSRRYAGNLEGLTGKSAGHETRRIVGNPSGLRQAA